MPKISIITINLNNYRGLQKTINSVVGQTYIDKEYIIIDGGSNDGSLDIIKEYDKRISFWSSEPDMGIYYALNKGIKNATGEWIIFMNSGDVFNNEQVLTNLFFQEVESTVHIIYGNTIVKENNKKIKPPAMINKRFFFNNTICHQSIFFNRVVFDSIGNFNIKYNIISDREFLLRAIIKKLNFKYVDLNICLWEALGYSSNNSRIANREVIEMINEHYNIVEKVLLNFKKGVLLLMNRI